MKDEKFDFEAFKADAIKRLIDGKGLVGTEGAFTPQIKSFLEEAMQGEIDQHLEDQKGKNRKNGKGSIKVRTSQGMVEVKTPRDRASTLSNYENVASLTVSTAAIGRQLCELSMK